MDDRRLRLAALVLAVVGTGVAAYLTYIHYEGIKPACGLGANCVKVQSSEWSKLAGIPVALLGLVAYVVIVASLLVEREETMILGALTAVVGFGFSAYLTYRELFSIHAICEWCASSAVIMTLLAIVLTVRLLRAPTTSERGALPYVG